MTVPWRLIRKRYVFTSGDLLGTNTSIMEVMTATEQPNPGFLDLPPEIRNRVYELALFDGNGAVAIDATWRPPPLLSTCKQIRNETLCMVYTCNEFAFTITNCNVSVLAAFEKHVKSLPKELRRRVRYAIRLSGRGRDWENLMAWCRHVWKGEVGTLPKRDNPTNLWTVVYGATTIARHTQGSWKACKLQLDAFRAVAGKLDDRWLQ